MGGYLAGSRCKNPIDMLIGTNMLLCEFFILLRCGVKTESIVIDVSEIRSLYFPFFMSEFTHTKRHFYYKVSEMKSPFYFVWK